jgi:hypothetical protein
MLQLCWYFYNYAYDASTVFVIFQLCFVCLSCVVIFQLCLLCYSCVCIFIYSYFVSAVFVVFFSCDYFASAKFVFFFKLCFLSFSCLCNFPRSSTVVPRQQLIICIVSGKHGTMMMYPLLTTSTECSDPHFSSNVYYDLSTFCPLYHCDQPTYSPRIYRPPCVGGRS